MKKIDLPKGEKLYFEFKDFSANKRIDTCFIIASISLIVAIVAIIIGLQILAGSIIVLLAIADSRLNSEFMLWNEIEKLNKIIKKIDVSGTVFLSKDYTELYYFSNEDERLLSYELPLKKEYYKSDDFKITYDKNL